MSAISQTTIHLCMECNKPVESFVAKTLKHPHKGHLGCLNALTEKDQLICRICKENIKDLVASARFLLASRATVLKLSRKNHLSQATQLQDEVNAIHRALGNSLGAENTTTNKG